MNGPNLEPGKNTIFMIFSLDVIFNVESNQAIMFNGSNGACP